MEQDEALAVALRELPAEQCVALLIAACREVGELYEWLCDEMYEEITALMEPETAEEEGEEEAAC